MWYPDYQNKKTQFVHAQWFQELLFMQELSHYVVA